MPPGTSWIDPGGADHFGLQTLPYGIAVREGISSVVSRIGDTVLDLAAIARTLAPELERLLDRPTLNPLMAAGPDAWVPVRAALGEWVADRKSVV